MFKRCTDIVLGGFLLILASPLLLIAAILIKIGSSGPILFIQSRVGRGFQSFRLFKLRTMRVDMQGSACTVGDDPRITRIGRWLRWSKLDEAPQLWNVIRGDMSLVGPRPMIPEIVAEFHWAYVHLLEVRPGLTDPATLKYCREAEFLSSVSDPHDYFKTVVIPDKMRLSLAYMENRTPIRDLIMLARTAVALLTDWRPSSSELVQLQIRPWQLQKWHRGDEMRSLGDTSHSAIFATVDVQDEL